MCQLGIKNNFDTAKSSETFFGRCSRYWQTRPTSRSVYPAVEPFFRGET